MSFVRRSEREFAASIPEHQLLKGVTVQMAPFVPAGGQAKGHHVLDAPSIGAMREGLTRAGFTGVDSLTHENQSPLLEGGHPRGITLRSLSLTHPEIPGVVSLIHAKRAVLGKGMVWHLSFHTSAPRT